MSVPEHPLVPSEPVKRFLIAEPYLGLPRAPKTWVVQDLLPASGFLNLYGAPKVGKSFAALQMAIAISSGEPEWLGFPIHSHGPVCYLQLDTPRALWAERLEAARSMGFDLSQLYIADRQCTPYPFDITKPDQGGIWLRDAIREIKPVVLFIDTLRESFRGDENDSNVMQAVASSFVAATAPSAVVLISHQKKENMQIPAADREEDLSDNRGSGYITGAMDAIVKFTMKGFVYQSRTAEKRRVRASRLAGGWWKVDAHELDHHIKTVLQDETLTSDRARARALADLTGRTVESCRGLLKRAA